MKNRCFNPNHERYHRYGGRGIKVCDEWLTFAQFAKWAKSSGYSDELTIERNDGDGNYEPRNCKWISRSEQARNRSSNRNVSVDGETALSRDWSEKLGGSRDLVGVRIRSGWDEKKAATEPPNDMHRIITYNSVSKTSAEWSRDLGGNDSLVTCRLRRGWSEEKAVTTPVHWRGQK